MGLTRQNPITQSQQLMDAALERDENCGEYSRD